MTEPLRLSIQHATSPKKRRRGPVDFDVPGALELADATFAGPCAGHMPRVEGRGTLLQRFVLPLDLCKTTNQLLSMMQSRPRAGGARAFNPARQAKALEEKVYRMMWVQFPTPRAEPLQGRPMLRMVRFSSVEPDDGADGLKLARDLLRPPKPPKLNPRTGKVGGGRKGFGFIVDDAPRFIETVRWWERVPPGKGFGLLEIWSG
jgi:hypothetical protein